MPGKLSTHTRYALYYGPGGPGLLDGYDLAILAPSGWSSEMRGTLQARGASLLAYLTVLEIPAGGPPPPHVLRHQGRPLQNPAWGNWILDPRHPETLRRLLARVAALRTAGWDGLFLDTVADVESPELPLDLQAQLIPSAARLVAEVAASWPSAALVQNWGFGPLLPLTAPYLDGVCWESFPHDELARGGPVKALSQRLNAWSTARNFRVFALNETTADPAQAVSVAGQWGFLWYAASGSYTAPPPQPSPPSAASPLSPPSPPNLEVLL